MKIPRAFTFPKIESRDIIKKDIISGDSREDIIRDFIYSEGLQYPPSEYAFSLIEVMSFEDEK